MSEMIERAARAAWEVNRERCAVEVPELAAWEDETEALREDWRGFARASIEAMRDPTQEMVDAAWTGAARDDTGVNPDAAWQAMIDAALK